MDLDVLIHQFDVLVRGQTRDLSELYSTLEFFSRGEISQEWRGARGSREVGIVDIETERGVDFGIVSLFFFFVVFKLIVVLVVIACLSSSHLRKAVLIISSSLDSMQIPRENSSHFENERRPDTSSFSQIETHG